MEQERPYRQYPRYRRATASHEGSKETKKNSTILTQTIVCVAIVGVAFLFKLANWEPFREVQGKYGEVVQADQSFGEMVDGLEELSKQYAFLSYIVQPIRTVQSIFTGGNADESGDGASQPSQSGDVSSENSSKSESSQSSSSETESASGQEPEGSQGGGDGALQSLRLNMATGSRQVKTTALKTNAPPDKMSFAPVVIIGPFTPPIRADKAIITSKFGFRDHPRTEQAEFHSGLDLAAPLGTPIVNLLAGAVKEVGYSDVRGNYVIIVHSGGTEIHYYHCSKVLVETGTTVRAGEAIALVGATGDATGPHLHLEIHIRGVSVDPGWILEKVYRVNV